MTENYEMKRRAHTGRIHVLLKKREELALEIHEPGVVDEFKDWSPALVETYEALEESLCRAVMAEFRALESLEAQR